MPSYTKTLFGLAAFCAGTNALTITSPSAQSYWVQFTTNTVAWSSSAGDPEVISLQIINPTSKSFAGPFSIAEYIKTAIKSYDITDVTLSTLDGYQVQAVDSTNNTRILATSAPFSVKVSGTSPAPVTYASGSANSSAGANESSNSFSNSTNMTNGTNSSGSTSRASSNFNSSGTANTNAKSFANHFEAPLLSGLFFGLVSLLAVAA